MSRLASPFGDEPLEEIPLPNAPLVRVVAQVRFPQIASVEKREFVGEFQEAIRSDYPILREEHGVALIVGPNGISEQAGEKIWRFHSGDSTWRVALAPTFIALETDRYESRDDFFRRFERVMEATADTIAPTLWERFGVRYVDRLEDEAHLSRLPELVRPEVLGLAADHTSDDRLQTFVGHGQFALSEDDQLIARTAILPPGGSLDPSIQPAPARSWTLDVDVATLGQFDFSSAELAARGRDLASRVYRYFRWAVEIEFLRVFGADEDVLRGLEEEQ